MEIRLPTLSREQTLLAYIADLELEVDRLRAQSNYLQQAVIESAKRLKSLPGSAAADELDVRISAEVTSLAEMLRDLREPPGYLLGHDQATSIALKPLIEQTVRWQQRVLNAPFLGLRLDLQEESVVWFPGRLRHILDNLVSNALRSRDPQKGEMRLTVQLSCTRHAYELRLTDNGVGVGPTKAAESLALYHRSSPARSAAIGVGLSVVRVLVEQSGGALELHSQEGEGACVVVTLPRFDLNDFID